MFPTQGLFFIKSQSTGYYVSVNGEDEVKKKDYKEKEYTFNALFLK